MSVSASVGGKDGRRNGEREKKRKIAKGSENRRKRERERGATERRRELPRESRLKGTRSMKGNCHCNLLRSPADTLSNKIRRRLYSVRAGEITSLRTKWTEI